MRQARPCQLWVDGLLDLEGRRIGEGIAGDAVPARSCLGALPGRVGCAWVVAIAGAFVLVLYAGLTCWAFTCSHC